MCVCVCVYVCVCMTEQLFNRHHYICDVRCVHVHVFAGSVGDSARDSDQSLPPGQLGTHSQITQLQNWVKASF